MKFRSTMVPPPGGKFFFEYAGERIEARYWLEMEPRVKDLMSRHGLKGSPAALVAEYMCPSMPSWYCEGSEPKEHAVRISEARENAMEYFRKPTVTFDVVSQRLQRCVKCPHHRRNFCLSCTGLLDWVSMGFSGRRVRVPEDKTTGVCMCARTLEAVIASIDYEPGDKVWEGVPEQCWRNDP